MSVNQFYHYPKMCEDCKKIVIISRVEIALNNDILCTKCYRKRLKKEGKDLSKEQLELIRK